MKKNKKISWKCRFSESNPLCLREIYVSAHTLSGVLIKLQEDLKSDFISAYLLEISFYSVYYE